jgi:hypothetical protein
VKAAAAMFKRHSVEMIDVFLTFFWQLLPYGVGPVPEVAEDEIALSCSVT